MKKMNKILSVMMAAAMTVSMTAGVSAATVESKDDPFFLKHIGDSAAKCNSAQKVEGTS